MGVWRGIGAALGQAGWVWVLEAGEVARSLEDTDGTWSTSMITSGATGGALLGGLL